NVNPGDGLPHARGFLFGGIKFHLDNILIEKGGSEMTEPQLAEAGPLPECFAREILPYFPSPLKNWLAGLSQETLRQLEEIRLRVHRPIICQVGGRSAWLNDRGQLVALRTGTPFLLCSELMQKVVALISQSSLYALETELSQGYLTLKGGHRVGFTG